MNSNFEVDYVWGRIRLPRKNWNWITDQIGNQWGILVVNIQRKIWLKTIDGEWRGLNWKNKRYKIMGKIIWTIRWIYIIVRFGLSTSWMKYIWRWQQQQPQCDNEILLTFLTDGRIHSSIPVPLRPLLSVFLV